MEHFNKRQMKIYIHARFTWGLHRRLLTCGMRGISGNNILQIVSFHLFTTNLPHTSISLILKIPRYFKVIKGQILKYHAENCRRIRIQQHMGLQMTTLHLCSLCMFQVVVSSLEQAVDNL
jgi:hypothetical protein